eukprot:CAMPEP_0172310444 /NCGR_PEP_ID=MMETSP1058-20130122/11489_1 /TAXON_ID=83371 /ORGANISM="Detonula confervacea, Strain CCMP 353" /LENGTH=41 /DNA_ID= /DNA_START= /DNA_END= /DNA_ORIENTATION=
MDMDSSATKSNSHVSSLNFMSPNNISGDPSEVGALVFEDLV